MKIAPVNNSLKYISNQKISRQVKNVDGKYLASGGIITSSVAMQQLGIIPSFALPIIAVITALGALFATKLGINKFSRLPKSPDTNNEENGLNENSQTQVLEKTLKLLLKSILKLWKRKKQKKNRFKKIFRMN